MLFWLKPRSTDTWPWLSVKIKATTDASFLNLETTWVSKYSLSLGNSINLSLNLMTLPFRGSLNSEIALSQHFVDSMFNFKICVRTIFRLSRTVDLKRLLENCRTERDRRKSELSQFGKSISVETIAIRSCWHSFLNLVTLAFETRSVKRNFLRVLSTPNPKSILQTLIKFSSFSKINLDESFAGFTFLDNFRLKNYFQQIFKHCFQIKIHVTYHWIIGLIHL